MEISIDRIIKLLEERNININFSKIVFKFNSKNIEIDSIVNIYKTRYNNAVRKNNKTLMDRIDDLLKELNQSLEKTSNVRILSLENDSKIHIIYLNERLDEIVGIISGEIG